MNDKTESAPFLSRVYDKLPTLHPAEKRLAEFILDFPGELASYSALELAQLSEVSTATVSRFVRRLGYENYDAARRHVRAEKQGGSPLFLADRTVETFDGLLAAHAQKAQENLERAYLRLDEKMVTGIVRALIDARMVWTTGLRANQFLARYFQWQLFQVKENSKAFPDGGDSFGEYLSAIRPADVVVVFGLRRRPLILYKMLEQLNKTGAQVLFITDDHHPLHSGVKWHIQCPCESVGPFDSHVSVAAVSHLLLNAVFESAGAAGRSRLAASDAYHSALEEF
ncbi:MurR/RpiR family transcriptional regulator [Paenalcaligenes niemegkensis]|uniref:MurR/RpiR family transcriptional regulator n=1 Tax=Paenalcaligenes niemegkensis TaxID=2895469 RepID=UPI001EE7FBA0|nr:MurR/RpiR family transcriptional regulator [Paenalcaligenes niemegkensis]MCQ9617876.1 MurR/RpiR family transcriptional regulator [Paenalcaligenes niemegkensis]